MKERFKKTQVRRRLTRAGHVERMGDDTTGRRTDRCPESEKEARKTEIAM